MLIQIIKTISNTSKYTYTYNILDIVYNDQCIVIISQLRSVATHKPISKSAYIEPDALATKYCNGFGGQYKNPALCGQLFMNS